VENTFFRIYGSASIGMAAEDKEADAEEPVDVRNTPLVKEALTHIEDGDRTKGIVRAALLLMKAGTGRRRLSAMKRARELVGKEIGLIDMPAEAAREIIREQSYIVPSFCRRPRTGAGCSICSTAWKAASRPTTSKSLCWARSGVSSPITGPEAKQRLNRSQCHCHRIRPKPTRG
jgi:hypothetical protein